MGSKQLADIISNFDYRKKLPTVETLVLIDMLILNYGPICFTMGLSDIFWGLAPSTRLYNVATAVTNVHSINFYSKYHNKNNITSQRSDIIATFSLTH